jgi:hypothetical protein
VTRRGCYQLIPRVHRRSSKSILPRNVGTQIHWPRRAILFVAVCGFPNYRFSSTRITSKG